MTTNDIEVDSVQQDAYLKGLAAGRFERSAELARLREQANEAWCSLRADRPAEAEEYLRQMRRPGGEAVAEGVTLRQIAQIVGLSHQRVAQIAETPALNRKDGGE